MRTPLLVRALALALPAAADRRHVARAGVNTRWTSVPRQRVTFPDATRTGRQ
ncbi:MAG TPA: hypothetical protein VF615_27690 [Longimicrobiaceae bacterium]|jgi:hypothetical protein